MKFSREVYCTELVDEMMPLWTAHHAETANKFYGPLDPNLEMYERCAEIGMLRIYTVRQQGVLCGYQVFIVSEHPHSKDWISATQDILYLMPQYRRGIAAYKFLKWCTDALRNDGINVVHQLVPASGAIGNLFMRLGYELEDLSYSKVLQEVS